MIKFLFFTNYSMFCALGYMLLSSIVVRQVELKLRYGQRHKKIISTAVMSEAWQNSKIYGPAYYSVQSGLLKHVFCD